MLEKALGTVLNCAVFHRQNKLFVFLTLRLYLQFAYDLWLGDSHQVSILNSKSREGNDRQKTGIDLLGRWSSWQHGAQDGLGENTQTCWAEERRAETMLRWLKPKQTVPDNVPLHQAKHGWLTSALHGHQKDPAHLWPPEPPAPPPQYT